MSKRPAAARPSSTHRTSQSRKPQSRESKRSIARGDASRRGLTKRGTESKTGFDPGTRRFRDAAEIETRAEGRTAEDANPTLLIIGDSEADADLYYATRFYVTVTVVYVQIGARKLLLVNDLEYGRAVAEAKVDEVISTTPYEEKLRAAGEPARITSVLDLFFRERGLRERGVRELSVPARFPLAHAENLREKGYLLKVREDPFFPQRSIKTAEEVALIESMQRFAEEAMTLATTKIRESEIRGGLLYHRGRQLTSEGLRLDIQKLLLERQCVAPQTIIAGGDQAADPHARGTGPLPAHKTIIIDIFPQSTATRYWGDMTRTVVRGKATRAVRKLFDDVKAAQDLAFSRLKDGADGQKVHEEVADLLRSLGNPNESIEGKKTGFIHSTGHGLGLDIHEWPRLGRTAARIQKGQVLTVEPGLYYPGVGAVRLEDVVAIEKSGCRNLNRFPVQLEP